MEPCKSLTFLRKENHQMFRRSPSWRFCDLSATFTTAACIGLQDGKGFVMLKWVLPAVTLAAGLQAALPATAAVYLFSGTRVNIGPGTVPGVGRCVPAYYSTTVFTPGSFVSGGNSNFGGYQLSASHCNLSGPPTMFVDGVAELLFDAGDQLFATYAGGQSPGAVPGTLSVFSDWVVTGGTGRFRAASGTISHIGTLQVGMYQGVPSGFYEGTFHGLLDLPAVPEPAAWGMLLLGFGLIGHRLRRNKGWAHA